MNLFNKGILDFLQGRGEEAAEMLDHVKNTPALLRCAECEVFEVCQTRAPFSEADDIAIRVYRGREQVRPQFPTSEEILDRVNGDVAKALIVVSCLTKKILSGQTIGFLPFPILETAEIFPGAWLPYLNIEYHFISDTGFRILKEIIYREEYNDYIVGVIIYPPEWAEDEPFCMTSSPFTTDTNNLPELIEGRLAEMCGMPLPLFRTVFKPTVTYTR